jgi:glycosyltransferase involved in cell wall biosynthesis
MKQNDSLKVGKPALSLCQDDTHPPARNSAARGGLPPPPPPSKSADPPEGSIVNSAFPKLSIIICSINPERAAKALLDIEKTIGIEYETIVFDNREPHWGICKVYNYCAAKAQGAYLCFMHEDVAIETRDWGKIICGFLEKTPDCGVIGFAGGLAANRNFSGWGGYGDGVGNVFHVSAGKFDAADTVDTALNPVFTIHYYSNPEYKVYSQALCVDGLFQCVKKSIWAEIQYDERTFSGFHFYDTDFSFAVSQKYTNYVFLNINVLHDSLGFMNKSYIENMFVFQKKWKNKLPYYMIKQAGKPEILYMKKKGAVKPRILLRLKMTRSELRELISIYTLCKKEAVARSAFIKQAAAINGFFFVLLFYVYYGLRKITSLLIRFLEKI